MLLEIIKINKEEQFMKDEIKGQRDLNIKDIYLEILNIGSDDNYIDAEGIQRFILKYSDQIVQVEKIQANLVQRKIHKLKNTGGQTQILFEDF